MTSQLILIYDGDCALCANLAAWVTDGSQGHLRASSWQSWPSKPEDHTLPPLPVQTSSGQRPESIFLWNGEAWLRGSQAWECMISVHPQMRNFHWVAQKLGIAPQLGSWLEKGGLWVKRWCRSCGVSISR